MAWNSVDYMAAGNLATAVQHYWSLSVAEQYYLVWPLLILGALLVAKLAERRWSPRVTITVLLGLIFTVSLWCSITETNARQSWAYFASFTRVWEFAAGGLFAVTAWLVSKFILSRTWSAVPDWLGVGMILCAAFAFTGETPFPGSAALLPVLGIALLLHFGASTSAYSPRALLSSRPIVWVGGISYSVYLWHRPLIAFLPFLTGHDLTTIEKVAIIVVTLLLAQLNTRFVEDLLRKGWLLRHPARAFGFAALGAVVFVSLSAGANATLARVQPRAEERAHVELCESCTGSGALDPAYGCGIPMGEGDYVVTSEIVGSRSTEFGECQSSIGSFAVASCDLGVDPTEASRKLVLA